MNGSANRVKAFAVVLAACTATTAGKTPGGLDWPAPFIAPDARLSSIGDHININGVPARIYRYTTAARPDDVARYFREHLERDVSAAQTSKSLPDQTAIAGRVGDFWVTLQMKQQSGQTVGTWSAVPQFNPEAAMAVHPPAGFPATAKVIQQVDSFDDDKRSEFAIGLDPGPVDGVAERLADVMRAQGFVKETMPPTVTSPDAYVSLYRKGREEVFVALKQERAGTSVTINRIYALEELK